MTTDITELAQDWKAAAHKAKQANDLYLEGKITLSECVVETKDYLDYSDNPNNFLALVEALEKAQRANAAQDDHINQQQDRIDQLEKAIRKPQSKSTHGVGWRSRISLSVKRI